MLVIALGSNGCRRLKSAWNAATASPDWAITNRILKDIQKGIDRYKSQNPEVSDRFPKMGLYIDHEQLITDVSIIKQQNGQAEISRLVSTKEVPISIPLVIISLLEKTETRDDQQVIYRITQEAQGRLCHRAALFWHGFKNPSP